MEASAFLDHFEQYGLFGAMLFEAEAAPAQQADDLVERLGRQIDAVAPGWNRSRRPCQHRQLLGGGLDLVQELGWIPDKTGVAALHRFVALMVEAPVKVVAITGKPVALAERVGKPTVNTAGCVQANQIATASGFLDGGDNGRAVFRQAVLTVMFARVHLGGVEQMWVFRQ